MAKHHFLVGANALFTPRGRINRLQFLLNFWACVIVLWLILQGVEFLPDALSDDVMAMLDQPVTWLAMVLTVLLYYAMFCLMAKRLHDLSLTAWIALVLFAGITPILISFLGRDSIDPEDNLAGLLYMTSALGNLLALILGVILTVWPGQAGDNIYGPSPNAPETDA